MPGKKPWREIDPRDFEPQIDDALPKAGLGSARSDVDSERPTCYNKAIDLLSRRPHFSTELRTKLRQRSYDDTEIEETLVRLEERRFLDDRETARIFVESKLRRGNAGRRKLLAELSRRGIQGELAEEAVAILGYEEELASGREAARRFNLRAERSTRRTGEGPDRESRSPEVRSPELSSEKSRNQEALARHLDRKGFSKRVILAILGEAP